MTRFWVAAGLMVLVSASLGLADEKKELEKFAGTWDVIAVEQMGMKREGDDIKAEKLNVTFTGDKYDAKKDSTTLDSGTLKVVSSKPPVALDIMAGAGPLSGKVIPAICELKGDLLTVCYDLGGKERPKAFETKPGTQLLLVTYKKRK